MKMNKKGIVILFLGVWCGLASYAPAAEVLTDVIRLKNGSVLKGRITRMTIGRTITMQPDSGVLMLSQADLPPSFRVSLYGDATRVFPLKNGTTITGEIVEMAPGKWYKVRSSELPEATYRTDSILETGKELNVSAEQFFGNGGLADVLILKDGSRHTGLIVRQNFSGQFQLLTKQGVSLVFDLADIRRLEKKALDPTRDLFLQTSQLDSVSLNDGGWVRGIIVEQIPGKTLRIATQDMERLIAYDHIREIAKVVNPSWIDWQSSLCRKLEEPAYVGDCARILSTVSCRRDSLAYLEKQSFRAMPRNAGVYELTGNRAKDVFPADEETTIRVRVMNNNLDPFSQIYLFPVVSRKESRLVDDSRSKAIGSIGAPADTTDFVPFRAEKAGESSFDITFSIGTSGEYAVYVNGCNQTFCLFRIE